MFSWDESKREQVINEHSVDFAKIADIFDDPFAVYFEDYKHSTEDETRFNIIGQAAHYGLIFGFIFILTKPAFILLLPAGLKTGW